MQINRRTGLLGSLATAAIAPLAAPWPQAAQPLSGQQAAGFYRYKVGGAGSYRHQ